MRTYIVILLFIILLPFNLIAKNYSRIQINVGIGIRPPYLLENHSKGAGPDIIHALNLIQEQFIFKLVPVPIKRRTQSLYEGWVDIIMWDNPNWGWNDNELESSQTLLHAKDVFIALVDKYQSQDIFNDLTNVRLAMVHGYHYKFVNYETDPVKLNKKFNITLVRTEADTINILLSGRVDMAITSNAALAWYFKQYPEHKSKILISDKYDTQYKRYFLVPKSSPISAAELNALMSNADNKGLLAPIYQRYGLVKPEFPPQIPANADK